MSKKFISFLLAISLLLMLSTVHADDYFNFNRYDNSERPISLQINGEFVEFDSPITSIEYVTYAQTNLLANKLNIDSSELETMDIEGVAMSPVRASADKKGWTTYWDNWSKTIIIIDTESLRNDFKQATSKYLTVLKTLMNIPNNGEFSFSSTFNFKSDGKDNGFDLYTTADVIGNMKFEQNKIAGNLTVSYDGINKLVWMIISNSIDMPYMPIDFSFYIDDSGIYIKSILVNMTILDDYYVSEEFKNNNINKWFKIGFDELEIEGLDDIDKFRNFDKEYAIDCFVNSFIFNDISPENAYVSSWTYDNWRSNVDSVVELSPNKFINTTENGAVIEFTQQDLQWALEKVKDEINQDEYYDDEEKIKNLELIERFIENIKGGLKTEYIFENEYLKEVNSSLNFQMIVPFYFNQIISDIEFSGNGKMELINIDATVITDSAPKEFFTNEHIEESHKYKYNNFETPDNNS